MIDIEFSKLEKASHKDVTDMGFWLEKNMPNSPLPEPQRWTIGYSIDGRVGIRFTDNKDATYFLLRWS